MSVDSPARSNRAASPQPEGRTVHVRRPARLIGTVTRRAVIAAPFVVAGTAAYAGYVEPMLLTRVTRYTLSPPGWTLPGELRVAVVADLHACNPWMGRARIEELVADVNALGADLIVMLGDYVAGHRRVTSHMPDQVWAEALAGLRAPLGVFSILGNHDWWADRGALFEQRLPDARVALEAVGMPVLQNDAVLLKTPAGPFWLGGLGDQWAYRGGRRGSVPRGVDDLPGLMAKMGEGPPVLLLVHEPDIFPSVPERVSLTLAGHTHGGQVNLLGITPVVPSRYGSRYVYGHIVEDGRNLIVSAGLGCSWLPVRFCVPPEIVLVTLKGPDTPSASSPQ